MRMYVCMYSALRCAWSWLELYRPPRRVFQRVLRPQWTSWRQEIESSLPIGPQSSAPSWRCCASPRPVSDPQRPPSRPPWKTWSAPWRPALRLRRAQARLPRCRCPPRHPAKLRAHARGHDRAHGQGHVHPAHTPAIARAAARRGTAVPDIDTVSRIMDTYGLTHAPNARSSRVSLRALTANPAATAGRAHVCVYANVLPDNTA